jgi:hypothetical protein
VKDHDIKKFGLEPMEVGSHPTYKEVQERSNEKDKIMKEQAAEITRLKKVIGGKVGKSNQMLGSKQRSEQLDVIMKQLLDRLIHETKDGVFLDVDWDDTESIKKRHSMTKNAKELLSMIKMIRETMNAVKEDEASEKSKQATSKANVRLIEEAKKQLDQAGIANDL